MGLETSGVVGVLRRISGVLQGSDVLPSQCPNVNSDTRDTNNSIFVVI